MQSQDNRVRIAQLKKLSIVSQFADLVSDKQKVGYETQLMATQFVKSFELAKDASGKDFTRVTKGNIRRCVDMNATSPSLKNVNKDEFSDMVLEYTKKLDFALNSPEIKELGLKNDDILKELNLNSFGKLTDKNKGSYASTKKELAEFLGKNPYEQRFDFYKNKNWQNHAQLYGKTPEPEKQKEQEDELFNFGRRFRPPVRRL